MDEDSLYCLHLRSRVVRNRPDPKLVTRRAKIRHDEDRDEIREGDDHRDEERDEESDKEKPEDYDKEKKVDEDGSDGSDDCSQEYYGAAKEALEEMKNESSFDTPFGDKKTTFNVDEKRDTEKSSSSFGIFIIIAVIIAISFLVYNISFSTNNIVDHHRERLLRWEKSFDDLVTKYGTALPEISRKVINKSVRNVLERKTPSEKFNELEPAIILLLGSKYNPQAVKCIYQRLSQSVSKAYNEAQAQIIDVINFSRLELYEKLHDTFSKGLHCIVVDGIERLDGNTALSLHTFTDHNKAPYLDVIIFLTAYTDNRLTNTSLQTKQMDEIASNVLQVSWSKNLPDEQVAGLLSRITPSVAIISDTNSSQNWLCE